VTADLQQLAGDLGLVSLTADAKPKRAASQQLEQDKGRKQKQPSSSSSKTSKRANSGPSARKRIAPQQQQQQQPGSSGSSSRPAGSAPLQVDAPLSLFELMVLLPGQQVDEVMEVQEMLGWLLFSDDH
jgi:hypothetical protein